jgi:DNA repair exonuclease SbcCD ATPase subunit
MLAELMTAMQSIRVATEIANGLVSLKTSTEIQTKVSELNAKILSAQQELFSANASHAAKIDEVRELKEQVARMERWDAQKQRYQLVAVSTGTVAYALKKSMSEGEPPHCICANCYESGKRSILSTSQKLTPMAGMKTTLVCAASNCKAVLDLGGPFAFRPQYAEDFASS